MPHKLNLAGLPDAVVERIRKEAEENEALFRARGASKRDLSAVHYGHARMLAWAFEQFGPELGGSRVLDVGAGEGFSSVLLAQRGARVTSIDLARAAIERTAELARAYNVKVDVRRMAGEHLQFDDNTFDAVLCVSAFHHMDLDRAAREFTRVLRPTGRVVLIEPLYSNPPAWLYRRLVHWGSRAATSEERPLRVRDLEILRRHFARVDWRGMFCLTLPLIALDRIWNNENPFVHRATEAIFRWLFPVDEALMRIAWFSRLAWKICILAEK